MFSSKCLGKKNTRKIPIPADRYTGSGSELAKYLLKKESLENVSVEITEDGDHYDPEKKAVRLTKEKYNSRSLTAITVAAHEVGHAIQDRDNYAPLKLRTKFCKNHHGIEKIGASILMISPFVLTKAPSLSALVPISGLLTMLSSTLPTG